MKTMRIGKTSTARATLLSTALLPLLMLLGTATPALGQQADIGKDDEQAAQSARTSPKA